MNVPFVNKIHYILRRDLNLRPHNGYMNCVTYAVSTLLIFKVLLLTIISPPFCTGGGLNINFTVNVGSVVNE